MSLSFTGQRQPVSSQYRVVACATAPVGTVADFTNKLSQINQPESSGKQLGAFAIREAADGKMEFMLATGDTIVANWLPLPSATTITPADVAELSLTTDLTPTLSAADGADATFTVVAAGGHAPLSYDWYWEGIFIDPSINPSADTASLVNHAVTSASQGGYYVIVSDADGHIVKSSTCVLTVA